MADQGMNRRSFLRRGAAGVVTGAMLGPALLSGCAAPAAQVALGTPAERITATGFAVLRSGGQSRGAVVGFRPGLVLTCAHLLQDGEVAPSLRRADGGETTARLVARSARMDLAVLSVPAGFLAPATAASAPPRPGDTVWAAGAPGLGPSVAQGHVEAPDAEMPGFGRGFTARMPALMGYSGGPVVDEAGRLLGLTAALPEPGAAGAIAFLTGADLDGLSGRPRRVFVLAIRRVEIEAGRLLTLAG